MTIFNYDYNSIVLFYMQNRPALYFIQKSSVYFSIGYSISTGQPWAHENNNIVIEISMAKLFCCRAHIWPPKLARRRHSAYCSNHNKITIITCTQTICRCFYEIYISNYVTQLTYKPPRSFLTSREIGWNAIRLLHLQPCIASYILFCYFDS